MERIKFVQDLASTSETELTTTSDVTKLGFTKSNNVNTLEKVHLFPCRNAVDKNGKVHRCKKHKNRIPSILVTNKDTVLAFANKRKENLREVLGDIGDWNHETDNVVMRSTNKGKTWQRITTIASRKDTDIHRGPVVIDKRTGWIFSFMRYSPALHNYGKHPRIYSEETSLSDMKKHRMGDYVSWSANDGQTWSKPRPINLPYPRGARGAGVANGSHGIQLHNGRVVIQARYKLGKEQRRILFYSDSRAL